MAKILTTMAYNLANLALQRPARLGYDDDKNCYFVDDKSDRLYIAHPRRNWRYKRGISNTVDRLAGNYHLDKITFSDGDVFIDCGANAGELAVWAKSKNIAYHGFEPDDKAADVCDLNAFDGDKKTVRKCLWFEDTTLKFYEKTDTADSSVFEIEQYDDFHEVPAITLDGFCKEQQIKKIKLLKVEAEGAEPEVIQGAAKILRSTGYVAVDCSYERGKTQEHTLIEVFKTLSDAKFELIAARMKTRCTFLFQNTQTETK